MRRPARAAAAALAAILALSACPGKTPPEGTASPDSGRGGEVVVAYPHEPATLNPFARGGDAPATRDLARLVMPALYRLGPGGARERWLLAREPQVQTGPPFAVVVELRDDAVWSDGTPITAADLRFTWRAVTVPRSRLIARDGYDRIADVQIQSERRARIVFDEPFRRWRDLFSAGLGVLPAHALAGRDAARELRRTWRVSGGPFVVERWRPGLEIAFRRNPRAWGGAPTLERLTVRFVPNPTTALALFRRGDADALVAYQGIDFARRARLTGGARVTSDTGATVAVLLLNVRAGPLAATRVRRALGRVLDRRRIEIGIVRDEGEPLDGLLPGSPNLQRPVVGARPDVAGARRLLARAGWRGDGVRTREGVPLRITVALPRDDDLPRRVARAARVQAERAGFDLVPVALDPDRLWSDWLPGSRMEAALVIWRDPPSGSLGARFGSGRTPPTGINYSRVTDRTLDRRLDAFDRAIEVPAQDAAAAQERLADVAPAVPLYAVTVSVVTSARIAGARAAAAADGPLWNAHEWSLA